ncbi:unnamed protein product [Protopolystoma xenopodis]|uniref:Uncharacterized protein n=1 Tax=Protopolystoma xenopodis TaxID=117903 RepID=A0A448WF57_9PLAT|nr:unnamed protein product [Protopolystoma xenopodis]
MCIQRHSQTRAGEEDSFWFLLLKAPGSIHDSEGGRAHTPSNGFGGLSSMFHCLRALWALVRQQIALLRLAAQQTTAAWMPPVHLASV